MYLSRGGGWRTKAGQGDRWRTAAAQEDAGSVCGENTAGSSH